MQEGSIPPTPRSMTPGWLTTALQSSGAIAQSTVTALRWEAWATQGWTTDIGRFWLTYDRPEAGAPETLVAKFSAQDTPTRAYFGRFYAREVAFYRCLAPTVPCRVPRCYAAEYDPATHQHMLLLEDLSPAVAGDLRQGVAVEVAMAYTQHIAAVHAMWWEQPQLAALAQYFPIHGRAFARDYAVKLEQGLAVLRPYVSRTTAGLARRLQTRLQERWERQYAAPRTLLQWDAHAANCLLPTTPGGDMALVDWQNCTIGRGVWDITRFCVLSLPVAVRRAVLHDLLALYTSTLAQHGVRQYTLSQSVSQALELVPLVFAQQLRFFASMQYWDAARRAWGAAIGPRVVTALHDVAATGLGG